MGKMGNKVTRKDVIDFVLKQHKYKYKYIILGMFDLIWQLYWQNVKNLKITWPRLGTGDDYYGRPVPDLAWTNETLC